MEKISSGRGSHKVPDNMLLNENSGIAGLAIFGSYMVVYLTENWTVDFRPTSRLLACEGCT